MSSTLDYERRFLPPGGKVPPALSLNACRFLNWGIDGRYSSDCGRGFLVFGPRAYRSGYQLDWKARRIAVPPSLRVQTFKSLSVFRVPCWAKRSIRAKDTKQLRDASIGCILDDCELRLHQAARHAEDLAAGALVSLTEAFTYAKAFVASNA